MWDSGSALTGWASLQRRTCGGHVRDGEQPAHIQLCAALSDVGAAVVRL
jgi:hypothetical protein